MNKAESKTKFKGHIHKMLYVEIRWSYLIISDLWPLSPSDGSTCQKFMKSSESLKLNPSVPLKLHTDQREKGMKRIKLETMSREASCMAVGWKIALVR